jgi:hypothetical protein
MGYVLCGQLFHPQQSSTYPSPGKVLAGKSRLRSIDGLRGQQRAVSGTGGLHVAYGDVACEWEGASRLRAFMWARVKSNVRVEADQVMLDPVAGAREGRRRDGKVDFLDGHVDGLGEERDSLVERGMSRACRRYQQRSRLRSGRRECSAF